MADMQWRKANGKDGTYTGPLVNLGHGIPRKLGDFGMRRAIYDLAFGYVSGFPVRDIIPFAARSLFPTRVKALEPVAEDSGYVGTVFISCPACGELMPATVRAEVEDETGDGLSARLVCTPDMTDVHAHVWSHAAKTEKRNP